MSLPTAFNSFISDLMAGNVVPTTDTLYVLLVSGLAPNQASQSKRSDVTTSEITGTGYTAGGQALTSVTATTTVANSWGTSWVVTTAYTVGAIVRPSAGNGFLYQAATAGTSGSSTPTWPTVKGETVTDGGVVWTCMGSAVTVVTASNPVWASASISVTGAVIYKHRGGASTADNLYSYVDFGGAVVSTGAAFTVTLGPGGFLALFN